jgi:hypothetical protein
MSGAPQGASSGQITSMMGHAKKGAAQPATSSDLEIGMQIADAVVNLKGMAQIGDIQHLADGWLNGNLNADQAVTAGLSFKGQKTLNAPSASVMSDPVSGSSGEGGSGGGGGNHSGESGDTDSSTNKKNKHGIFFNGDATHSTDFAKDNNAYHAAMMAQNMQQAKSSHGRG